MKYFLFLFICLLLCIGCNNWDEEIVGEWQAYFISVDGQELEMDYAPVNFLFTKEGQYVFNSTINYKEAGSFYLNGDILFTLDTLNTASTEKAVQVVNVTQDSLFLKMMTNGKDKLMKLHRLKD